MGTTVSRPIFHAIETTLLSLAELVDRAVRQGERFLSDLLRLVFTGSRSKADNIDAMRACDDQTGICYVPATRAHELAKARSRERQDEMKKRRKQRAEWAAAGLDVRRMEREERVKKHRGPTQQEVDSEAGEKDEKASLVDATTTLGEVARAPPPRPEEARQTAAEKDRGKLWIMGNMARRSAMPKEQPLMISIDHEKQEEGSQEKTRYRAKTMHALGGGRLEAVREASFGHGHGHRGVNGSEHGDVTYQILATSHDAPTDTNSNNRMDALVSGKKRRSSDLLGMGKANASPPVLAPSLPETTKLPKRHGHSKSLDVVNAASSFAPVLVAPKPQRTLMRRHLNSVPTASPNAPKLSTLTTTPSQDPHDEPTSPISSSSATPLVRPVARRANSNRAASGPGPSTSTAPSAATSAARQKRASLDVAKAANAAMSTTSLPMRAPSPATSMSDTSSIRKFAPPSRSNTSTPVAELADRACRSRWEASAKERKVWKGEVERITLQRLSLQQTGQPADGQAYPTIISPPTKEKVDKEREKDKKKKRMSLNDHLDRKAHGIPASPSLKAAFTKAEDSGLLRRRMH